MYKDLGLAMNAINKSKLELDHVKNTYEKYENLVRSGKGNLDFSIIVNNLNK